MDRYLPRFPSDCGMNQRPPMNYPVGNFGPMTRPRGGMYPCIRMHYLRGNCPKPPGVPMGYAAFQHMHFPLANTPSPVRDPYGYGVYSHHEMNYPMNGPAPSICSSDSGMYTHHEMNYPMNDLASSRCNSDNGMYSHSEMNYPINDIASSRCNSDNGMYSHHEMNYPMNDIASLRCNSDNGMNSHREMNYPMNDIASSRCSSDSGMYSHHEMNYPINHPAPSRCSNDSGTHHETNNPSNPPALSKDPGGFVEEDDDPFATTWISKDPLEFSGDTLGMDRKRKHPDNEQECEDYYGDTQTKKAKDEVDIDYIYIIAYNLNKTYNKKAFRDILTNSQWLEEVPPDFEKDWKVIPCPPGKRVLIVAGLGCTRCFTKTGDFMYDFESALPGGHPEASDESSKSVTVLDCIWHEENKAFYIIDVLQWNTVSLMHCDAEFRFFWLVQKFVETSGIKEVSADNKHPFHLLPRYSCATQCLTTVMGNSSSMLYHLNLTADGFLFYNLKESYQSGDSSAVGWLKPFMVSEVLNIQVHPDLLKDCPKNYQGFKSFIEAFKTCKRKIVKREKRIRLGKPVDVEPPPQKKNKKKKAKKAKNEEEMDKQVVQMPTKGKGKKGKKKKQFKQ